MDILKKYNMFETKSPDDDPEYEQKIIGVIEAIIKKKQLVSMLSETIRYVSEQIEKTLPLQIGEFMEDLYNYDEVLFEKVDHMKEKLIDGYPNVKDLIEEIEKDIEELENYMKLKNDK